MCICKKCGVPIVANVCKCVTVPRSRCGYCGEDHGIFVVCDQNPAHKKAIALPSDKPYTLVDLHDELGKLKWVGTDEGWDLAIAAVRDYIREVTDGK